MSSRSKQGWQTRGIAAGVGSLLAPEEKCNCLDVRIAHRPMGQHLPESLFVRLIGYCAHGRKGMVFLTIVTEPRILTENIFEISALRLKTVWAKLSQMPVTVLDRTALNRQRSYKMR